MTNVGPPESESAPVTRICFVCSGNICRSPMAEVVLRDILDRRGYGDRVEVSSAGTGRWHLGQPADPRAVAALERRGFDGSAHVAEQFQPDWFERLDLVVALDRGHERILKSLAGPEDAPKIKLLLDYDDTATQRDVPDPYYSDDAAFDTALDMIVPAVESLADRLTSADSTAGKGAS